MGKAGASHGYTRDYLKPEAQNPWGQLGLGLSQESLASVVIFECNHEATAAHARNGFHGNPLKDLISAII